jgi:hypothetical protein
MAKILTVSSLVQKAVLEQVLFAEMQNGFWKNARPADHADYWKGVQIQVVSADAPSEMLGAAGFDVPRNYNFVNPDFFRKAEDKLMAAASLVQPGITVKQLKKQLITLNQIIGARLKEVGGTVAKLSRGRKQVDSVTPAPAKKVGSTSVRKAMANFAEAPVAETV